jgi:phosphoglycolate phosphatase/pyrophosphatase PpaX
MQKLKGVIFDLDGTIADTLPLCILAFRKAIEPLVKRPLSDIEIIGTFGPSEEGSVRTLAPAHYDEALDLFHMHYKNLHDICPDPFDGITEILAMLQAKKIRMAMVTGKGRKSMEVSMAQFHIDKYFELIETGSPTGPRKTEAINKVLASWTGITKDEVIYVGDMESDISASRAAGIRVISAAWASTSDSEKLLAMAPDEMFETVDEFADWLNGMV